MIDCSEGSRSEEKAKFDSSVAASTYNTYIVSQHRSVRDVSTNVSGFGFEGRPMKALRFRPLFQSHKHVAEPMVDALMDEKQEKRNSIIAHERPMRKLNLYTRRARGGLMPEKKYQFARVSVFCECYRLTNVPLASNLSFPTRATGRIAGKERTRV